MDNESCFHALILLDSNLLEIGNPFEVYWTWFRKTFFQLILKKGKMNSIGTLFLGLDLYRFFLVACP
jgi:hypothetical protein